MKTFTRLFIISIVTLISISQTSCKKEKKEEIPLDISILPMYGMTEEYGGHKKTPEQIQADRMFLLQSDESGISREDACEFYLSLAQELIDSNSDLDLAMKRTNQAWQLDGLNQRVYVTFAQILSVKGDLTGAIDFLERAININRSIASIYEVYLDAAVNIYLANGDTTFLNRTIELINQVDSSKLEEKEIEKLNKIKEDAGIYLKTKPN